MDEIRVSPGKQEVSDDDEELDAEEELDGEEVVVEDSKSKPEIWVILPIENLENYEVSSWGRVRNIERNYIMGGAKSDGYRTVNLTDNIGGRTPWYVHILIALAFISNPENKPTVDHINQVRDDNRLSNLRWFTHKEQEANKIRKTTNVGLYRPVYQLDKQGNIIKRWDGIIQAANELGLDRKNIGSACNRKCACSGFYWKYAEEIEINKDEVWKKVQNPKYQLLYASNLGRIKNKRGRIYKGTIKNGYVHIKISLSDGSGKKNPKVHRLVLSAFLGPDIRYVNHKDGNKTNNKLENLEYCTAKENAIHAVQTGLRLNPGGPRRKVAKLDNDGNVLDTFNSIKEAKESIGVKNAHISDVCNGSRKTAGGFKWKYL